MADLSILIPARNEMFLAKTVENILENIEGDTEIIVVEDGFNPNPPVPDNPRVIRIHYNQSVGQRRATNEAIKLSRAKYVMKVDAHCAFDKGFDVKMMKLMQDDITMVPVMRNLWAFDWVCEDRHRRYQGPEGNCLDCGKPTHREIVWVGKPNPQSTAYVFNTELRFQYWNEWGKKQKGDLTETMSIQGSCFMVTRKRYLELNLCDETWGSWGNQGTEVACKTWLSGGRVLVNRTTWYAHLFRTQTGFSFPYPNTGKDQAYARKCSRELFLKNSWDKAKYPLYWLIKKFNPPGWENMPEPTKGIIYYTDNQADPMILDVVQKQLLKCCNGHKIVATGLKPMNFGHKTIILDLERSRLTMFKQILTALENIDTDIVFFCEHDVLYHPSHFDFTPERVDLFYYNDNKWKVDFETGQALFYHCAQTSGLCAWRHLLLRHYRWRVEKVEKEGYNHRMGYEPGTHSKQFELWNSEFPNIDIRHKNTLTANRWSQDQFRDKNSCLGWTMADEVPGWGRTKGRFREEMLSNI